MASAAATEAATLYDVDMPQHHQLDPRHDHSTGHELVDDQLLSDSAATASPEEDEDRQSYPLGQSHTPLTSIPTLGQALIDGNNIDRKYVHSFLQVLADHSQFSDKYQHYEEDEYERKRKRKLRESERKMFFYAGQGAGGASGDKSKRKTSSMDKGAGSTSTSNKKRRRKERERERERVFDKDVRRQLSGSAPLMSMGSSLDSASSRSSSPFNSPPTAERAGSMPNMPWTAASTDRTAFYSASVPAGMPAHAVQDMHQMSSVQAASQLMRPRASMPQLPTQQYHPRGHSSVGAFPLHHSASAHYSPSSSFDFMPQPSPLSSSSTSSSLASSSYHFTSPAPSPASHIVPIKATDYAPSPPTYHHPLHHHHQQHQQSYASYYQPQPAVQRYHQHQQPQLANSMPAEMLLDGYGGHFTAEAQPNDTPLDESWTSSSSSISSGGSGELSGSESFSCFGPFDPAALGSTVDGGDLEGLACADMASAAAAAVENYIFNQQLQQQQQTQHLKVESSPEGQQQQAGNGDEDWFNSFFDCTTVGSPVLLGLGGNGASAPVESTIDGGGQCYTNIDSSHLDSLFADVESFYGRMVN